MVNYKQFASLKDITIRMLDGIKIACCYCDVISALLLLWCDISIVAIVVWYQHCCYCGVISALLLQCWFPGDLCWFPGCTNQWCAPKSPFGEFAETCQRYFSANSPKPIQFGRKFFLLFTYNISIFCLNQSYGCK